MTKKKRTLVAFLLDETGSMSVCRDSTIAGFNEYVQGLQNDEEKYRFTLVKFDSDHTTVVHSGAKPEDVAPLTRETYTPGASTPLYDAVAHIIEDTESTVKKNQKVIVVIMTDGEENASREHTTESIKALIKQKRDEGWAFMFLGANQDAWQSAGSMGIPQTAAATYQQGAEKASLRVAHIATQSYAKGHAGAGDVLSRHTADDGTLKTE